MVNCKSNYNLVGQLQRNPAQILIFELLELSPRHKQVLEDALCMVNVPNNLDIDQFQNMVNHIASSHYLTFLVEDNKSFSHSYNLALHIENMIYKPMLGMC